MPADGGFSPGQFATAFQRFLEWVPSTATPQEGTFAVRLREHFGADASTYPITSFELAEYDRPNLQAALDAFLSEPERTARLLGFGLASPYSEPSLSQLVASGRHSAAFTVGPVARAVVALGEERSLSCVTSGLFLVDDGDRRLAVLVTRQRPPAQQAVVEVMAPEPDLGEAFVGTLRRLMTKHNVYRGKVVSLAMRQGPMAQQMDVTFHPRHRVARERIVLPDGLLERVERSTVEFDRHAPALRSAGRHLRRGLLLYGAPGTGKTLTATYLADALAGRTVLVLTGRALGLIRATCAMARQLQPSMVVLEDIDLVAEERTQMGRGATSLLFELLNEIDGMEEDANVIFVMTTNRADLLEPALAARPGRVDQAVEFPLPDAQARRRLIELFCEGLSVHLPSSDRVVEQTEGASPAFLRELVRKAALNAAADGHETVEEPHFARALDELEEGGRLTRSILGAGGEPAAASPAATGFPAPSARG
jgi:hypothetical protein